MDGRVLALAATTTLLSGLLIGVLPAWRWMRSDPARWLQGGGRGASPERSGQRTLAVVVAVEVALACVLLVGAGLLLRSFRQLTRVELGFDPDRVLTADLVLPESRYSQKAAQTAAFSGMLDELTALPGVERAAFVIGAPLEPRGGIGHTVLLEGRDLAAEQMPGARVRPVMGDYFAALGQPVVGGRAFTPADDETAPPVAIVNQQFARQFWPGASPLGARIAFRLGAAEPVWMTIVGVAADLKSTTLDADDTRAVYYPYRQRLPDWQRFGTLVVRSAGDPAALARSVREAVWRVDPTLPLTGVTTLDAKLHRSLARERFTTVALAAFAATALLLAVLGVYGVLAWAVERRRREIGVRMALGALRRDLVRGVVTRALGLAVAGLGLGLFAAAVVTRGLGALLYQVAPTDPATYALAALVLLAVTALGGYLPARRASRVDPVEALRGE
jgi:putative ABC transport system permease protein